MADSDRLIHYVCTASSHRRSPEPGLTRHNGGWALCPDPIGIGHEWTDTGGLEPRDAVSQWRQTLDPGNGPSATAA